MGPLWLASLEGPYVCGSSVTQLCLTLCNLMDYSPPDSSLHGILQARILEWDAISFSRGYSSPRGLSRISCIPALQADFQDCGCLGSPVVPRAPLKRALFCKDSMSPWRKAAVNRASGNRVCAQVRQELSFPFRPCPPRIEFLGPGKLIAQARLLTLTRLFRVLAFLPVLSLLPEMPLPLSLAPRTPAP